MILVGNYYLLFGSDVPLSLDELKKRYHSFSKIIHPDINVVDNDFFDGYFMQITSAYQMLRNKKFKVIYDKILNDQNENIEFLESSNIVLTDLIDSSFIKVSDKLDLGVVVLAKSFNEKTLNLLIFYFLNLSPKHSLRFIKKIEPVTGGEFYESYYELLFEVLLNHSDYFDRFLKYLLTLNLNEKSKSILLVCEEFKNETLDIPNLKKLSIEHDLKLLHLLLIKIL